ncbi:hypothetical protein AMK59_4310, partial [Oryctes borbonicus]
MSIRTTLHGLRIFSEFRFATALSAFNSYQQVRYRRTKHWDPKWKLLRRMKVIEIELPKYNENIEDLSEEELRSRLKEQGLLPTRPWMERQFHISCTGGIFEPYVPPEGDGKISPITAQGAKQKIEFLEKKTKTMMAIRKIRTFEEDFDTTTFCNKAEDTYIKLHELLVTKDKDKLRDIITERAYPEVMHNMQNKTIHWKFIKNVELPRVVHARCTDIITKENIFAQLTVRFHTQQVLAIYDRFGRLMHGSEIVAKDVLEYVVFEKHLANEYGIWRIHEKIIPDWMPSKEPPSLTYKSVIETKPPVEEAAVTTTDKKDAGETAVKSSE